jgi:hypothetical protein
MLALVRPDSWNLPLFLHVLGATLTFGATTTVAVLGFAGIQGDRERTAWLRSLTFWVGFGILVPAFILMRGTALWILDKEFPGGHNEPGWVNVGFAVSEPGALLVIVMVILAWLSRSPKSRVAVAVPWLAAILLAGLAVAWFAMSAKPGS